MVIMDDLHFNTVYLSSFLILFSETCITSIKSIKQIYCQFIGSQAGLELVSLESTAVFALNFLVIAGHYGNF